MALFGLHPVAPLARYEAMGLVWILRGREVVGIDAAGISIASPSGARLTFRRTKQ
jgi:hypothetical protein